MAENNMLNIEDMEIVLDDGTPTIMMDVIEDTAVPDGTATIMVDVNEDTALPDGTATIMMDVSEDTALNDDDIFDFLIIQEIETPTIETKIEVPASTSENENIAIVYNLEGNTIQSHDSGKEPTHATFADAESTSKIKSPTNSDDNTVVEGPRPRQFGKIPIALRGLIGQAKMFMLKKNYDMAIKICVNILKECPNASEPFFTLSDIYEQLGDIKKSLETAVIGNSLSNVAPEDWVLLGETCEANNMLPLTDFCLTKAIQKDKRNLDLHIRRASIMERLGTAKSALYEYDRLLRKLRPDQKDSIITLSKLLIDNFVKDNNYDRATSIFIYIFNLFPNDVKPEDFLTCINYLMKTKSYKKSIELFVEYYDLEFVADVNNELITEVLECVVPSTMPMLIRIKLIEIMIQLKSFNLLPQIYEPVLNMNEVNQFHLDIANAFYNANQHEHAILFLELLINYKSELFDQHALKIKFSDCLKTLGLFEQAVDNYSKLLEVDPDRLTIKYDLYISLRKLNRIDESLEILLQCDIDNLDCRLLYEYVLAMIDKDDMFEKCLKAANLMLSRHCVPVHSLREVKAMMAIQNLENRYNTLLTMKKELYGYQHNNILVVNPLPRADEEWIILCNICLKCSEHNFHYEGLKILLSAMNSALLAPYNRQIVLNTLKFAFKTRAYKLGYMLSRYLLQKFPLAPQMCNLFCFFLQKSGIKKQTKFIFRLAAKYPDNVPLNILDTNVFNDTYNYQLIFSRYTELLNKLEDKSTLYFMLGVVVLRLCTFKVGTDRHSLALQGIGFLMKYKEHRGVEHEQECYFNIARAYHQVGMAAKALHFYKLVLQTEPIHNDYCLKNAAAYNLHLIYMESGNTSVALMYISHVQV